MIRCGTVQHVPVLDVAQHQVVQVCAALGRVLKAVRGSQNVVVHQVGPVGYFHHQVPGVVQEQVAADARALGLPVVPHAQRAVVQIVSDHLNVDGRVQLDGADLPAEEFVLGGDAADLVSFNNGPDTAHVAHDAVLPAVVDEIVPDDVGTDGISAPAQLDGLAHRFELVGIARFLSGPCEQVVPGLLILAQADAAALRVMDMVILDDPSLAPVRADQSRLVAGGRREGAGGLRQLKPGHGDVVFSALRRIEDAFAHVDLGQLPVRVRPLEVGPDGGVRNAHPAAPLVNGVLRIQNGLLVAGSPDIVVPGLPPFRFLHFLKALRFIEALSVQVHLAQVQGGIHGAHHPVAVQILGIGIEGAEHGIRKDGFPHGSFHVLPAGHPLGALDHHSLSICRTVGDAGQVSQTAHLRVHPFAVFTGMYNNGIAGHRQVRCPLNGQEGSVCRTRRAVVSRFGNMICSCHFLFSFLYSACFAASPETNGPASGLMS